MSTVAVRFLEKSMTYLNFGRTSQIRTGDLYHVNIDGCTNVHSSTQILTLDASIESLQQRLPTTGENRVKRSSRAAVFDFPKRY